MRQSRLPGLLNTTIIVVALLMVAYHLYAVFRMPLGASWHANTHVLFVLLMIFLPSLQSATNIGQRLGMGVAILLTLVGTGYIYANTEHLEWVIELTIAEMAIGIILLGLVFEAARRALGIALPLLGLLFILYALLGHYIPEPLGHLPVSFSKMMIWGGMNAMEGIYGRLTFISANIIFLFIMFGVMLEITKAREFFNQVGLLAGRKLQGGTGMAATISSGLVGMITGCPVSNSIITGAVTIPMMSRSGFKLKAAAAVEAAASSGGVVMPPVMGTVAFMMMSISGETYLAIIAAAVIPAVIWFLSAGFSIFLYAGREKIPKAETEVDLSLLWRRAPLFLVPFGVISVLLAMRYPPMYAAGWAFLVGMILGLASKETRPSLRDLVVAFTQGAARAAQIGIVLIICGAAFMSVMSLTAFGPKLGGVIHTVGAGNIFVVLVLTMFISLLLGMVNPSAGGYLLVALVTAPLLMSMGLNVIQAHFFALYFGTLGYLTPPVAPAPIVTAQIANVPYMGAAWQAMRFMAGVFLLPFLFAFDASLLGNFSSGLLLGALSFVLAIIAAVVVMPIVVQRYYLTRLSGLEILLGVASLAALVYYFIGGHNYWVAVVGVALLALLTFVQVRRKRFLKGMAGQSPEVRFQKGGLK